MKSEKNMFLAFLLNLSFAIFEFIGGLLTGSIAIASDALHDLGDAAGIGLACWLEKKSHRPADDVHTFGYARFSVVGSAVTTLILIVGSVAVMVGAVRRILNPVTIDYHGMILFAVVGLVVNLAAALLTHRGESLNQKAINLHMLEDVLGWAVVLIGAIVMAIFRFPLLDPLLSLGVAVFILCHALGTLRSALDVFLEKATISVDAVRQSLQDLPGVEQVHHIHLWSLDGVNHLATLHIVTSADACGIRAAARHALEELGIHHATIEVEAPGEAGYPCTIQACHHHHHCH